MLTRALAHEVAQRLKSSGENYAVEFGMRYGNPPIKSALEVLKSRGVSRIIVLPLYPQYAESSFETAVVEAKRSARELGCDDLLTFMPPFYNDPGFITKMSAVGSYVVPKIDVLFAGTVRSDQGGVLAANWNASSVNVIQPALGRPVAGGAATTTINLIAPGDVWGDRVNELDFRFGKIIKFSRMRINAGIDIYNILNQAAILTYNQTFAPGGAWLVPQSLLSPRFIKLGAQIDF